MGQQGKVSPADHPVETRQVSGIVTDSTGAPVAGATIKLISARDSLLTSANKDGIFIIENVRSFVFVVTVSEIGFKTSVNKYLNSDQKNKIVLRPIVLLDEAYQLKQVNVSGRPSIIYKTDTVEYRASDYKVPPYATVDQLLRRMEGMEVGTDGSLVYNGQTVTKAKLNGKVFSGGSVAQAIQNLPANIADKIQIVDDYGDRAARTGIKDGVATKTLNITTRTDKSIGTLATLSSEEGNHNRYNEQASVQNLYANRVINFVGNLASTVNGIASVNSTAAPISSPRGNSASLASAASGGGTSLPGTTQSGAPTFSYTNTWNNQLTITGSYAFAYNNTNSVSDNYGQIHSSIGPTDFKNNSTASNNSKTHTAQLELDYNLGKFDYLQLNPTYSYSTSNINSNTLSDNINYFTTGFEHPVINLISDNPRTGYNYGVTALYVHSFTNPKRNFSIQGSYNRSNTRIDGDKRANYRYFSDSTQQMLVKDSLSHLLTFKNSENRNYRAVVTYVEPIGPRSQLEFTAQLRNSIYDNKAISDTVLANGQLQELTRLENIYDFSFTDTRITADYRNTGSKSNLSIGIAVVPTFLSGTQIDNNTGNRLSVSRSDFRIIPVFRYAYSWSTVERLQIIYSGTNSEPNFQQLQPFTDRSDPNNVVIGNPNLKATFIHTIIAGYNKYFPNQKFNISVNINGSLYTNQIATNIIQVSVPISPKLNETINEINYVNLNGNKAIAGAYSISKQLNDRNYSVVLNGNITYAFTNAVSNNILYHTTIWDFNERFGPRITLNEAKLLINPYVGYEINRSFTNTLNSAPSMIKTARLAVDGQIYLPGNFQFHYVASKNFISGFANYTKNPLVINAGCEKRLLRNHNLALTFNVFDPFHQNDFIQQTVTPLSTTYTQSNTNSRYFLIGARLNFQHWGGTPTSNGKPMKRRGDGSFIN
jgi:hypothetical protein